LLVFALFRRLVQFTITEMRESLPMLNVFFTTGYLAEAWGWLFHRSMAEVLLCCCPMRFNFR
jgi:hypothetical protein